MEVDLASVRQHHERAMDLLDESEVKLQQAYQSEREAAMLLDKADGAEPTRSVLFCGAATLAFRCRRYREAAELVGRGLAGNPPADVAGELRALARRIENEVRGCD